MKSSRNRARNNDLNRVERPPQAPGAPAVKNQYHDFRIDMTKIDIQRTVKMNMLNASVDKVHRDVILGHSLHGMDAHYMAPSIEDLHRAMTKYTEWLDSQLTLSASINSSG
jgi:hypothetical protein